MRLTIDDPTGRDALFGRAEGGPRPRDVGAEAIRRLERLVDADRSTRDEVTDASSTLAVREHGGGASRYLRDDHGDVRRLVEADGTATTFAYDQQRRLSEVGHPDGTVTSYHYGKDDRLRLVDDRGRRTAFAHDPTGRLRATRFGDGRTHEYAYDGDGRLVEGRTPSVATVQRFDDARQVVEVRQTRDGVTISARLEVDERGCLIAVHPPDGAPTIRYRWDASGRMAAATAGGRPIAAFGYDDADARVWLGNGVVDEHTVDPVDRRPLRQRVLRGERILLARALVYDDERVTDDGARHYRYDPLGRLVAAEDPDAGRSWHYCYDPRDNRVHASGNGQQVHYHHDAAGLRLDAQEGGRERWQHDRWGRPVLRTGPKGQRRYRYDAGGQLVAVEQDGAAVAGFDYDHRGRLVAALLPGRVERYLYGPDDTLLAVTDADGRCLRVPVHGPLGVLAEVSGGAVRYLHADHQGTVHLATGADGEPTAAVGYCPFGEPIQGDATLARFCGHPFYPEVGLYRAGARWYDPALGRFLTPDSYTGAPDDARLVRPGSPASAQAHHREAVLDLWLAHPRVRNRYAYCGNDPVGRIDPDGHWSFFWVLLNILGAIWTSPNTLLGIVLEIACLALEVVRWLVSLVSGGRVTWEPPGFDAAASSRLDTAALVFRGGALGSFPQLHGITFGNVFFVYGGWEDLPRYRRPGDVLPPAYDCEVPIPRDRALYEHLLRHTNQYGWFGPSFIPVYLLDRYVLRAWFDRDAQRRSGLQR